MEIIGEGGSGSVIVRMSQNELTPMLNLTQLRQQNAERRKRKEAATEGPWEAVFYPGSQGHQCIGVGGPKLMCASVNRVEGIPDANFIAHARNDAVEDLIDSLLDEVERLTNRVNELENNG